MNLKDLSPAPWEVAAVQFPHMAMPSDNWVGILDGKRGVILQEMDSLNDAEFIAMARNAFDVMMRRGWYASRVADDDGVLWWIVSEFDYLNAPTMRWPDPFTALVESDRWYKENVEGK